MDKKKPQTWCIEITLTRTFDGTREEAEEIGNEDFNYYESQVDGDQFVNTPTGLDIYEVETQFPEG
jgi:hypothetical protein